MMNERNSAQPNTPTSANIQYGYPANRFDPMNMSPMHNPNDLYSYYPTSLYQPFGTFDEHNQWGSTDLPPPPGPLQYHPQMYTPTGLDMSHNLFDYPPPPLHPYPHYHPGFTPSTGDMSWNPHNLSMQQQLPLIENKKSSVYDEYPSTNGGIGDMLAQQMNAVHLENNETQNRNVLSSKEQQQYQSNSSHRSFTHPSQIPSSSGPKSYASVVSSDTITSSTHKSTPSLSNLTIRSNNERTSNAQQTRNSRYQQQSSDNEEFLHWTNNNPDRSSNSNQTTADQQYNPKDFNLNPKGARFFVIKSYSEDDVHRSIKYNIWCSTEHGNKRLDSAFREREGKGPIYLFFSVNASGHFCGMAEMMSPVDYEHQTNVWQMSNKWQGKFEVKWIYVKDVPNQQFRNIRLENNENKPVTNSRDTQEIPYEKGKLMLKTLHMYRHKTSLFDDFQYYESKQAEEITTTPKPSNQHRRQGLSNRTTSTNIQQDEEEE
jgi:hypothetical protein